MPMPCALRATVPPMRPRPMTPSFLPSSSKPVSPAFGHSPAFMPASARGMWRASANSNEIACSAAASVLPSGAFITAMPLAVAASTSMVSTPAPARPMTFSPLALANASAGTLVADRTSTASTSANARARTPGSLIGSGATRTSHPASRNRARPSSWMPSQASTFIASSIGVGSAESLASRHDVWNLRRPAPARPIAERMRRTEAWTLCYSRVGRRGRLGMGIRDGPSLAEPGCGFATVAYEIVPMKSHAAGRYDAPLPRTRNANHEPAGQGPLRRQTHRDGFDRCRWRCRLRPDPLREALPRRTGRDQRGGDAQRRQSRLGFGRLCRRRASRWHAAGPQGPFHDAAQRRDGSWPGLADAHRRSRQRYRRTHWPARAHADRHRRGRRAFLHLRLHAGLTARWTDGTLD